MEETLGLPRTREDYDDCQKCFREWCRLDWENRAGR